MTSTRTGFFSAGGHAGFPVSQGSIRVTLPAAVVSAKQAWPSHVILFPFVRNIVGLRAVAMRPSACDYSNALATLRAASPTYLDLACLGFSSAETSVSP